jgi:hypothetical protein
VRQTLIVLVGLILATRLSAQPGGAARAVILERAGRYVEHYYERARAILSRETVRLQRLDATLRPEDTGRVLIYELRIESAPDGALPSMTRRRLEAGGRLLETAAEGECFDPPDATVEPLAMLLPNRQKEFVFTVGEVERGRVTVLDFVPVSRMPPTVTWRGACGNVDVNGSTRGRVWIESATGAVLRLEERLDKPFQFVLPANVLANSGPVSQTVDRFETSIRYEPVTFRDPDETLLLPKSARTFTVIANGGVPRLLTLQSFDKYQRFVTGGRVVK